jgi:hypothetical protein
MTSFPLPQTIDPGHWDVLPGEGAVSLATRRVWVPLDDTEYDASVRAHEMAHVRFSPARIRISAEHENSYLFAEDGRVGMLARALGVNTVPHVKTKITQRASPRLRARVIVALLGGDERADAQRLALMGSLDVHHRERVEEAIAVLSTNMADPASARTAAKIIDRLPGPDSAPERPLPYHATEWGRMHEEHPPLPLRVRIPSGRTQRADERGAALRFPHRYLLDRRMFGRIVRVAPAEGTLLIDASASMALTPGDISDITRSSPALVAVYSGLRAADGFMEEGYLRIVARDGHMTAPDQILSPGHGGGNVVDGAALRWLSEQRAPRVWYSDGHMTGRGDFPASASLIQDADQVRRSSAIQHCRTLDAVRAALGSKRTTGARPTTAAGWVQGRLELGV